MQNVSSFIINKGSGYKWRNEDLSIRYLKLHIDNSLYFKWKPEDIIIATNFPFEHMGVKTHVIETPIRKWSAFANKLMCIDELIQKGIITREFWHKDLDAFQLEPFDFPIEHGVGFTQHAPGRSKPQGGSSFFAKDSLDLPGIISEGFDIFRGRSEESFIPMFFFPQYREVKLKKYKERSVIFAKRYKESPTDAKRKVYHKKLETSIRKRKYIKEHFGKYCDKFQWINWTYNLFRVHDFHRKYPKAEKPIKIVHFKPHIKGCYNCFIDGKNRYNVNVVDKRLKDMIANEWHFVFITIKKL